MSSWVWPIRFFVIVCLILPVALILGLVAVVQPMFTRWWRG